MNPYRAYRCRAGPSAINDTYAEAGARCRNRATRAVMMRLPKPLPWCAGSTHMSTIWNAVPPSPMTRPIPIGSSSKYRTTPYQVLGSASATASGVLSDRPALVRSRRNTGTDGSSSRSR